VELLVSTREAARRLGIGKTNLFHLLNTELGAVRLGGRTMIPVSELQRFAAGLPRRLPSGKMEPHILASSRGQHEHSCT
jgi:excisionase family DNA binding protein